MYTETSKRQQGSLYKNSDLKSVLRLGIKISFGEGSSFGLES